MPNLYPITQRVLTILGTLDEPNQSGFDINTGWCWLWALAAQEALPGTQIKVWIDKNDRGHAFIFDPKSKLYYDATSPTGVKRWQELFFFGGKSPSHLTLCPGDFLYFVINEWSPTGEYNMLDSTQEAANG
ncbi:MAG TPA: hypothetical protein VI911_09745 [Patescibacteria group bacterium]|nr:hypothetical protein [Patescibacteria group bacterium]